MRCIETPVFTSEIQRHLTDDAYQELQVALLLRPDRGAVIPGSGGLRKIRWSVVGRRQLRILARRVTEEFE